MADLIVEPNPTAIGAAPPPVEPVTPVVAPTNAPGTASDELPEDLIALPAIQGLLAGQPPAFSANIQEFSQRPEGQAISAGKDALLANAFGIYRSLDGANGVLFNTSFISDQDIKNADKAGKLLEVAPPFDSVTQSISQSGAGHPLLAEGGAAPTGAAMVAPPEIGAMPEPAMTGPPTPQRTIGTKMRNLAMGSPSSGPAPGSGRILNEILKPVL